MAKIWVKHTTGFLEMPVDMYPSEDERTLKGTAKVTIHENLTLVTVPDDPDDPDNIWIQLLTDDDVALYACKCSVTGSQLVRGTRFTITLSVALPNYLRVPPDW